MTHDDRVNLPARSVIVVLALVLILGCSPRPGGVTASWESSTAPIKVRVLRMAEVNGGVVPGAYYLFQVSSPGAANWRDIMMFRHDDPVEIPHDQVHVVNDRLAYLYMGWQYAVTTDGGRTWSVWDAGNDLSDWKCCNYGLIKDVEVAPSGRGIMHLSPIPSRRGEVPALSTTDFGQHWSVAGG